jgi:hypothetical protein
MRSRDDEEQEPLTASCYGGGLRRALLDIALLRPEFAIRCAVQRKQAAARAGRPRRPDYAALEDGLAAAGTLDEETRDPPDEKNNERGFGARKLVSE